MIRMYIHCEMITICLVNFCHPTQLQELPFFPSDEASRSALLAQAWRLQLVMLQCPFPPGSDGWARAERWELEPQLFLVAAPAGTW